MKIAELLNLDAVIVEAHAAVYHVYALDQRRQWVAHRRAVQMRESDQNRGGVQMQYGGSLADPTHIDFLTIAASYLAVVDPRQAVKCFRVAAKAAFEFASERTKSEPKDAFMFNEWFARAATLSICGRKDSTLNQPLDDLETQRDNRSPSIVAAEMMLHSNLFLKSSEIQKSTRYLKVLSSWAARNDGHVVGRMRIPIALYRRLADAVIQRNSALDLEPWLKELGERIDQQLRIAQTAMDHWEYLHSALLPIEPDVLSLLLTYLNTPDSRHMKHDSLPNALQAYLEAAIAIKTAKL